MVLQCQYTPLPTGWSGKSKGNKKILPFKQIPFSDDLNKLGTLETLKEGWEILQKKEKEWLWLK